VFLTRGVAFIFPMPLWLLSRTGGGTGGGGGH
jgi:hypothetical protein